jgi:hypothetical protein
MQVKTFDVELYANCRLILIETLDGEKSITMQNLAGEFQRGQDFPVDGIATPFYDQQLEFFRDWARNE